MNCHVDPSTSETTMSSSEFHHKERCPAGGILLVLALSPTAPKGLAGARLTKQRFTEQMSSIYQLGPYCLSSAIVTQLQKSLATFHHLVTEAKSRDERIIRRVTSAGSNICIFSLHMHRYVGYLNNGDGKCMSRWM